MRKRLLLLNLLLCCFAFVANAQFTMTLSATPETCTNNGTITVDVANIVAGDYISLQLRKGADVVEDITGTQPVTGTTFQHIFTAKNHGVYTVEVRRDTGGNTETKEGDIEIEDKVEPLQLDPLVEDFCAGVKVTANTTAGRPVQYRLLKPEGTPLVDWQASKVITVNSPFTEGVYRLQVKDDCEQIKVAGLTLKNPVDPKYAVRRTKPAEKFRFLADCDHYYHIETLIDNSVPGDHIVPEVKYPIQVKIEVENPGGGAATVINTTWDGTPHTGTHIFGQYAESSEVFNIPYYPGETYEYKVTFTDACGKIFVHTEQLEGKTDMYRPSKLPAACGEWGIATPWLYDVLAAPVKVTFTQAPAGFKPSEYNTHFTGDNMSAVFTEDIVEMTLPRYEFIDLNDGGGVPEGIYTMKFEACGKEWIKTFEIPAPVPLVLKTRPDRYGCGADKAAILLFIGIDKKESQADDIATIEFTQAPSAFVAQYGALPYDASANIAPASDTYSGRFFMNSLPVGDYEVKVTGVECGGEITGNFTLVERVFEEKVKVTQKCGGNFDIRLDVTSNMYYETYYLQKWYENAQNWGDPFDSDNLQSGTEFNKIRAYQMGDRETSNPNITSTYYREALNLNGLGKFRIVMTQATYGNGRSALFDACPEVIEEFEVKEPAIKIINYNVLKCAANGKVTLLVEATGIEPLKYRIIKKDGVSTNAYPETEIPAWENLDRGTYTVEIKDKCGNTRTVDFAVERAKIPLIKSQNLCDGENGKIYLDGAGFLKIKWFKDNEDTGVEGVEYPFTPFNSATDAGLYEARLYFPSSNAEICAEPITLDLTTITATVEAGEGQQNAEVCADLTAFVDLFDYINGVYNNWGDWSDPNDTGALNGSTLDINALVAAQGLGTYTFKYKVKGHCTGEDETTVKLTVKNCLDAGDCPESIPADNPTAALTKDQVSMELDKNGPYPGVVKSITVEGEPHPFTYLYLPDDASYDIQNPQANSNKIAKNGVIVSDITKPDFKDKLVEANASRDLDFYMMNDFDTKNGDYIQFTFNEPIRSAGNRYVVVTERWGNNPYIVNVLNSAYEPMGTPRNTIPRNQPNTNYIPTGFIETSHGQEVYYAVYPLTAFVTPGVEIYGIRLTQNSGAYGSNPSDGGDGKIFILADQFTLAQPPIVEGGDAGITITPPTCADANGGAVSFTANGVYGKDIECSINGAAGPFQSETTFSNLSAGTYTLRLRYVGFPNCFTDYTITILGPDCTDSDGDGKPDFDDLDDDNDGIPDCKEKGMTGILQDAFVANSDAVFVGNNTEIQLTPEARDKRGQVWSYARADFSTSFTLRMEAYLGTIDGEGADGIAIVFQNDPKGTSASGEPGRGIGAKGIQNGIVLELDTYNNFNDQNPGPLQEDIAEDHGHIWKSQDQASLSATTPLPNLEDGKWHNVEITWDVVAGVLSYTVDGTLAGTYTNPNIVADIFGGEAKTYFGYTASTGWFKNFHKIRFNSICDDLPLTLDSDGDGVPNHLDLDSDNDGCVDAIEGDGNFTAADVVTAGGTVSVGAGSAAENQNLCADGTCVDGNGIPTVAAGGQGVGVSEYAGSNACEDSDNDGKPDYEDLDDDNDGILDTDECAAKFPVWTKNGNALNTTVDGNNVVVTRTGTAGNAFVITMNSTTVGYNGFQGLNATAADALGKTAIAVSIPQIQTTFNFDFANPTAKDIYLHVFAFGNGTSVEVSPNIFIESWNNSTKHGSTMVTVLGSGANDAGFSALVPAGTTAFSYTLTAIGGAGDGHFAFLTSNCVDTDGDGIPNYLDLDSDNDGCLDAIEGDGNFTAVDLVDAGGTVTVGSGSSAENKNLCNSSTCVDTDGVPDMAGSPQGIGGSQIAAKATLIDPLTANKPCEGKPVTFRFKMDTEGDGWNYQLQKKNGGNWEDVQDKNGSVPDNTEVSIELTATASDSDNGEYRIIVTSSNNSCPVTSETTVTVNPVPVFDLKVTKAKCVEDKTIIEVTVTNTKGNYQAILFKGDNPDTGTQIDSKPIVGNKITFEVDEAGEVTYSVRVINTDADSNPPCETDCPANIEVIE